jgi:hypothetical protein
MSSYGWFYSLHNLHYINVTLCIYRYQRINENRLGHYSLLSNFTLLHCSYNSTWNTLSERCSCFFFREEESTVHRGRMPPPPMPLSYLILQAVMLQFHHALLCGYDLSHPLVQSINIYNIIRLVIKSNKY